MRKYLTFFLAIIIWTNNCFAQKCYLGNYLVPTESDFQTLGTSSATNVTMYKYKKEIYDSFFGRKIGDIIVEVKNGPIIHRR